MKDQSSLDTHGEDVLQLRELQAQRETVVRQMTRLTNGAKAMARRALGWQPDLEDEGREKLNRMASKLIKDIEKGNPSDPEHVKAATAIAGLVLSTLQARSVLADFRKKLEKRMVALAEQLPVWLWVKDIRGCGALGLAQIIGEAGDLSGYANPAKLWKRFGLAPKESYAMVKLDGEVGHTVPRRRRSVMWSIGDALIKANGDGSYKTLYDKRKAYEHERDPEMSKMYAHRRAQRYMEKRLLRDLWQAWKAAAPVDPCHPIPSCAAAV